MKKQNVMKLVLCSICFALCMIAVPSLADQTKVNTQESKVAGPPIQD